MSGWKTDHVPGAPKIAIEHGGNGPLVLFMHGVGGNRSNWQDQLPPFAKTFTLLRGTRAATAQATIMRGRSTLPISAAM